MGMWDETLSSIARALVVGMILWILGDPIAHSLTQTNRRRDAEALVRKVYLELERIKGDKNRDLSGDFSKILKNFGIEDGSQQDSGRYFDYQLFTDDKGLGVRAVPRLVKLKERSIVPGIHVMQRINGDLQANWYPEGLKHQSLFGVLFGTEIR